MTCRLSMLEACRSKFEVMRMTIARTRSDATVETRAATDSARLRSAEWIPRA